jgi:hypothetical protein
VPVKPPSVTACNLLRRRRSQVTIRTPILDESASVVRFAGKFPSEIREANGAARSSHAPHHPVLPWEQYRANLGAAIRGNHTARGRGAKAVADTCTCWVGAGALPAMTASGLAIQVEASAASTLH